MNPTREIVKNEIATVHKQMNILTSSKYSFPVREAAANEARITLWKARAATSPKDLLERLTLSGIGLIINVDQALASLEAKIRPF